MKLRRTTAKTMGNYTWKFCNVCKKRFTQVPGGKPHKCKGITLDASGNLA